MKIHDIEIRQFGPDDSIEELTALLHRAYARLGSMGLNYTAVDQAASAVTRLVVEVDWVGSKVDAGAENFSAECQFGGGVDSKYVFRRRFGDNLRLAQVTPYPDVAVQAGIANDMTPPGPSRGRGRWR